MLFNDFILNFSYFFYLFIFFLFKMLFKVLTFKLITRFAIEYCKSWCDWRRTRIYRQHAGTGDTWDGTWVFGMAMGIGDRRTHAHSRTQWWHAGTARGHWGETTVYRHGTRQLETARGQWGRTTIYRQCTGKGQPGRTRVHGRGVGTRPLARTTIYRNQVGTGG